METEKNNGGTGPEAAESLERAISVSFGAVQTHRGTQRGLSSRQAQMIGLGSVIGTGLFVGAGQGLHMGGPLFLLLSYLLITVMMYGVATATGEMSAYLPVPGSSMSFYANRFVSKSLAFTLGWVYWYIFAISVPAEITATTLVIKYWNPPVHDAVWITLAMVVVIGLNCFPVKIYGEIEFWFASTKVIAILGLLILSVVLFFGGGPSHEPLYFSFWKDPGFVNTYLVEGSSGYMCGFLSTLVFSIYAFAFAPELLVITGGEMKSPRRNLPTATRRYFYRLVLFYVFGVIAIGIIVPSNNPDLLSGSGAAASPWAIGTRIAGIRSLDSVVNAVIVLSAWSSGNASLYLGSRSLYSMSVVGSAPKIFSRCNKYGVPYYATAATSVFSLLAYLNLASAGATVFNWFVNLISSGCFQSWVCCCFIYVRYRYAMNAQGVTEVPFRSRLQPYFAWVSGTFFGILLLLNGYKVFVADNWDVSTFLASYIGIVIFAAIYFGHKFTVGGGDPWMHAPMDVDLVTGLAEVLAQEQPPKPTERWYLKWRMVFE